MAAPVSDDPEKARIAALFKRLLAEHGFTHQSFAGELEVSAGLVSQWATNRGGVPPERAAAVAALLKTTPEAISLAWRNLKPQFLASQHRRLDRETILAAVRLASGASTGVGLPSFEIESAEDAELFALALEEVLDDGITVASDSDVQRFARKLKAEMETGDGKVGKNRSNGGTDRPARKAQAGNASRPPASRGRKRAS